MTVVNLSGFETLLGVPGPITSGEVRAEYWAGYQPFTKVTGDVVTFPAPIIVPIVDGAPTATIELEGTGGISCVKWTIRSFDNPAQKLVRYTTVPSSGTVNFGDLPVVNRMDFVPEAPTQTLVETIQAEIASRIPVDTVMYPAQGADLYVRGTSWWASPNSADVLQGMIEAPVLHNAASGGSNTPSLPYQYADHPTDRWIPGTTRGAVLMDVGIGEALSEITGREAHFERVFTSAVTTAIRWHHASAVRKPGHSSITLGGGVLLESLDLGAINLNPGIKFNTAGQYFEIVVGAGVRDITILSAPWRQSAEAENGAYTITVNGGPAFSATTVGMGDPRNDGQAALITLASVRLPGVKPGDTVRVTKTGAGTAWFYGYLEMASTQLPPVVLSLPFSVTGAVAGGIDKYRAAATAVAALPEFQGLVALADSAPWIVAADRDADTIHPTTVGRNKLAMAAYEAMTRLWRWTR